MTKTNKNGKGDSLRPVDKKKFDSNWDKIFSKPAKKEVNKYTANGIQPSRLIKP